jgi:integrase
MPPKSLMSWEGHPGYRWVKMFRGRRYRVSCDELNVPRTKQESRQAANEWWQKKLLTLQAEHVVDEEQAQFLADLAIKIDYAANNDPELLPHLKRVEEQAKAVRPDMLPLEDEAEIDARLAVARLLGIEVPDNLDLIALQSFFGSGHVWPQRLAKHRKTETNRTVGFQLGKFLEEMRSQQKPKTHLELSAYLNRTLGTTIWASETSVDSVDEQTVSRHYHWLVQQNFSPGRHNKVLSFFRRFVEWLVVHALVAKLPLNLKLKQHRKKPVYKAVKTFDHVRKTIDALPLPYRLWALLCVNTGMTNADLGHTDWKQIDAKRWTLTRRRVKTGHLTQSPTVCYELWPETIEALKQLPNQKGLLFTTEKGTPMYSSFYRENGTVGIKDLFGTYWQRSFDPKPPIPLGKFRSIGASMLKRHEHFRQYGNYFLANVPMQISDKNYSAESDEPFFRALRFIRKQLGYK